MDEKRKSGHSDEIKSGSTLVRDASGHGNLAKPRRSEKTGGRELRFWAHKRASSTGGFGGPARGFHPAYIKITKTICSVGILLRVFPSYCFYFWKHVYVPLYPP